MRCAYQRAESLGLREPLLPEFILVVTMALMN